ncbi:MAG: type I restriction-modification system subunit M [Mycoplasmataceae bacterium]|nr:type I restriction-modification system subunit M [Mycoplasmataceae bacterium]
MDNKKDTERQELFKTIWKIAEEQRCAVDGWDFKQYILGTLFYRFISENLVSYIKETDNEEYEKLSDEDALNAKEDIVKEKGFFIKPSGLFNNVWNKSKTDKDYSEHLNEHISKILNEIEASSIGTDSEQDIKGLFDDYDVNSNKLGVTVLERNDRLVKLIDSIGKLNFGNYKDNSIDLFGDAYEFLMGMYASKAGKSGGEFFTPQEVSELLTQIAVVGKTSVNKVYDPACGSGSLLLKFAKILGKDNVHQGFYGQELNPTTYNLCRINMFLHDINYEKFNIARGDTLINPQHINDEPFEAIVSNPPYSVHWQGDSNPLLINDPRFSPAGVLAPKSKADFAFIMHCLKWLSTNGTASIVVFPGILYRGGAEQKIRKYLVDNNYVDCIIQLPSDLFFGTAISTCILVVKKSKKSDDVLFIDASQKFVRTNTKNKLSEENINDILNLYKERKDVEYIAKVVSNSKIKNASYNLTTNTYIQSQNTTEVINIEVLNEQIKETVAKVDNLRNEIDKIVEEIEK